MNSETPTPENTQNQLNDSVSEQQNDSPSVTADIENEVPKVEEIAGAPAQTETPIVAQGVKLADQSEVTESHLASQTSNGNTMQVWRWAVAIGVLLVLCVLWYFANQQMQKLRTTPTEQNGVTITVSDDKEQGTVTIVEQNSQALNTSTNTVANANLTIVKTYYLNTKNNPNLKDCSNVTLLEKQTERKYSSQIINTMRGLLEPLTAEQQTAGWSSAIPTGVLLKSVVIRDGGVAEANFTSGLKRVAGSCAVTAARAQIEQTLKQFSGVKSVRICIDGNCNQAQILQP